MPQMRGSYGKDGYCFDGGLMMKDYVKKIPWALLFIASMIAVGIGFWYYYLPVIIVGGIIAFISGVIVANHFIGNIEKAVDELSSDP